jgi:peptide/nickel transport system substrate-binding protein
MQYRFTDPGSYTLYMENAKKGDYRVIKWRNASTNCVHPNINGPDEVLSKLMDTPKFRQALSIAINRKEMNELIFNGLYNPRQASPVKGSPNYDAEFEKKWAEYDVATANKLLDELGLKMGADGKTRTRPDGKPLQITIETMSTTGSATNDEAQRVAGYWTAVGVKTTVKQVERSLYEQHCHNGELDCGHTDWGMNRNSIVMADPGRYTGATDDGPWAPLYAHWYTKSTYKQVEPPADHPIRKVWDAWDKTQLEPDETKRNALFKSMIDIHKEQPWNIGTCGENPTLWIARNNFRNVPEGRINDDPLRDEGLGQPFQYYFES